MRYTKKKPVRGGRLRKRWYFNAGANLPIIGKTNIAFGSGRLAKRSLIATVRKGLEEPLHKLWSKVGTLAPSTAMTQNTIYSINLCGNIPQGTSDNSRSGDTIHLEALKMNLYITNGGSTNANTQKYYRAMVVSYDLDALGGSDSWGSAVGSDIFQGNNNPALELVNPKNVTVFYDKTFSIVPMISSTSGYFKVLTETVRFDRKFIYKTGTNFGKHNNLYLVVMGFENGGTTATTVVGSATFQGDLIFKDCK